MSGITPLNGPSITPLSVEEQELEQERVSLNLSPDTLTSLSNVSSVGPITDASSPKLSLFEFYQAVSTSLQASKETSRAFDAADTPMYKDYHRSVVSSISQLRQNLIIVKDFEDEYNDYVDTVNAILPQYNNKVADLQSRYDALNGTVGAVNAATAAYYSNPSQTTLNAYLTAAGHYNDAVDNINGRIQDINEFLFSVSAFYPNSPNLPATRLDLIAKTAQLNLGPPTVPTLPPFAIPGMGGISGIGVTPTYVNNLSCPLQISTQPTNIDHAVYKELVIQPIKDQIKSLSDGLKRIKNQIKYQGLLRTKFGAAQVGSVVLEPVASTPSIGGTGSSAALATISTRAGGNVKLGESQLISLNTQFKVSPDAQTSQQLQDFSANLITSLFAGAVPQASGLAQSAIVGDASTTSPAIQASVALASLTQLQGLINQDAVYKAVLQALKSDKDGSITSIPELSQIIGDQPGATLEGLARGIAAAITLEVIKNIVIQVEAAIGLSGLLPQLLASLGSISTDSIVKLINGQINYKNLFDSPVDLTLVQSALTKAVLNSTNLSQQEAQIAVNKALADVEAQGPFASDSAAQQALKDALLKQVPDNSNLSSNVDDGFQTLESNQVQNKDLSSDDVVLNDQQKIQNEIKQNAFEDDLRSQLEKEGLDKDEARSLAAKASIAAGQAKTIEERNQLAENVLDKADIEDAASLIEKTSTLADSSLRTPFVDNNVPAASKSTLTEDFTVAVSSILTGQGVPPDIATNAGAKAADILFNGPTSVASRIEDNIKDYATAVEKTQANAATEVFKDSIRPTISTLAFLQQISNPADAIIYSGIMYGDRGLARTGPAGGVAVNPIISV